MQQVSAIKFKEPWQEAEFKEWLEAYKDVNLNQFANFNNCRPSSTLCAILNMYFLHDLGHDVIFHFDGNDDVIEYCYVETLEKDYHTRDHKNYTPISSLLIPAEFPKEQINSLFYSNILTEDTRAVLIQKSRNAGQYKDKSRGKNRFERKKYSTVAKTVKQYNSINMNDLFKKDILQVDIPVIGETNNYTVTIKMEGVIAEMQKNIKNNQNKFEYRTVIQALTKVFNSSNIYVKCDCDDFKYRFAHHLIINKASVDDSSADPGPGKGIANPNDDKGRGCKHILAVLANADWINKVAATIRNYILYAEERLQKPFLNVIFPKLYGIPAAEAVEEGIVESEDDLKSTTGLIDKINTWAKTRGLKQNKNKPAPEPEDTIN